MAGIDACVVSAAGSVSASRASGEDRDAGLIEAELLRPCWAIHLRAGDPDVYSRWPLRPELVDPGVALGIWRNTKTHHMRFDLVF